MSSCIRPVAIAAVLTIGLAGCVLAPRATRDERLRAARAGEPWSAPRDLRVLPELPAVPTWEDVLRHALVANGDLEAVYHEWRAALARIDVAAGWPDTNLMLGYERLFSGEKLKSFDRNTFTLGIDPMRNLSFPTKSMAAGRQALEEARAAGARFVSAKLALQRRVLTVWWELALDAERLRLARADADLAALARDVAAGTVGAGAAQSMLIDARLVAAERDDAVRTIEAEVAEVRARLNALLARPAGAPLALPEPLPPPRVLDVSDEHLLAAAVAANPDLGASRHDLAARHEAVGRARQEWIPDFNPFVGFMGGMAQVAGVMITLPARVAVIRGAIADARAMEAGAAATAMQAERDLAGEVVATLAALRDAERHAALWRDAIVPATEQLVESVRAGYEAGAVELATMIEAERAVLDARAALAEARATREMRLADLEALAGFDVEALAGRDEEGRS
jgi:outer membrane protein, heavy metal efflux system